MKHYVRLMVIILLLALGLRHNLNEGPVAVPVIVIPSGTSVGAVAWSPDGKFIAYSDLQTDTVIVWDIKQKEAVQTFQGEVYGVNSLDWSDDDKYLAASGNWAIVWDVTNGTTYPRLDLNDFVVNVGEVAWHPGNRILAYVYWNYDAAVGSGDIIRLWNLETQKMTQIGPLMGSPPHISWNPDGTHLAISNSEQLQVWDIKKSTVVSQITRLNRVIDFDWSADGQMIALATEYDAPSKHIQLWGIFESKLIVGPYIEEIRIQDLDWNPEFDVIAYVDDTRTVSLWELHFNKIIFQTTSPRGVGRQANYTIGPVQWSDDGQFLATVDGTGNIVIWKVYL